MTAAGMPFGGGQVDEPAFAQQVDPLPVLQRVLLDEVAHGARARRAGFSSAGMSISTLKWPELQMIAPSFITSKCSPRMTCLFPVTVMKTSPMRGRLRHRHDAEAVHHRLQRLGADRPR